MLSYLNGHSTKMATRIPIFYVFLGTLCFQIEALGEGGKDTSICRVNLFSICKRIINKGGIHPNLLNLLAAALHADIILNPW